MFKKLNFSQNKSNIIDVQSDVAAINILLTGKNNFDQIVQWFLINPNFNIDTLINNRGETILHIAAATDNAYLINWLIKHKQANMEIQDKQGFTPWLRAVQQKKPLAAETLKDLNANLLCANKNGENAAHFLIGSFKCWDNFKIWMSQEQFLKLIEEKNIRNKNSLHYACEFSTPDIIEELCKRYPKLVNEATIEGKTPIFYAIRSKSHVDVIKILINCKAKIEYKDAKGFTPWLSAIQLGKLDEAKCLKDYEANLLCENNDGENGAHFLVSILKESDDILNYIPKSTLDKLVAKKNKNLETPLHIACRTAGVKIIEQLCALYPNLISTIKPPLIFDALQNKHAEVIMPILLLYKAITLNENNENILHLACKNSSPEVVEAICNQCPELISAKDNNGQTPLFYAIQNPRIKQAKEIILALLKLGADIEHKDAEGYTPWLYAIRNRYADIANYLRYKNVVLSCVNNFQENALHLVVGYCSNWKEIQQYFPEHLLEYLVKNGDYRNKNALHYACEKGKYEIVSHLCRNNIELINKATDDGSTPIFYAIKSKSYQILIEILINNRVNIETKDAEGYTPWLRCVEQGKLEAANFLREKGANVKVKNDKGENILCILASYSNKDKEKWLPKEKIQQLIKEQIDQNYIGFMKNLFLAAAAKAKVQLPENYTLLLFHLKSYPEKEVLKDFSCAVIIDKISKETRNDLNKVCEIFNSFVYNMGLSTKLNKSTGLINTPEQLAIDICQVKFEVLTTVDEVLVVKNNEKLVCTFFESVKSETLKWLDYNYLCISTA